MVIFDVIPAILELNSQMNFRFGFGNPRNGQPDDSRMAIPQLDSQGDLW